MGDTSVGDAGAVGSSPLGAAFYGDDFTGSVDVLLQFARRGWRGRLFVGTPAADDLAQAAQEADVVGIAGISRSLPVALMRAEVEPALHALAALSPAFVQYKVCSTADSAPEVGSIGRVLELGREVFGPAPVPVLFAQPDFGRFTVFGHHFARENGRVHRLDRQPTMSTHPATPMRESDLARHLEAQTPLEIDAIGLDAYVDADALRARLRAANAAAVVLDALTDEHLSLIGAALADTDGSRFVIGSGGLSAAIAMARPGTAPPPPPHSTRRGPMLAVSGSRSAATRRQIAAAERAGWLVEQLPATASAAPAVRARVLTALTSGRSVALASHGIDTSKWHPDAVLPRLAERAADLVVAAVHEGATGRVIVCGGDTSSRVVSALGITALSLAAHPGGNLVLLRAHAAEPRIDGLELLLKGGQVGDDDLFETIRRGADGEDSP